MNKNENLLTEQQSSEMAGVSIETIRMYASCGLLQAVNKDNQNFFKEIDIKTLFYSQLKDKKPAETSPKAEEVKAAEQVPQAEPEKIETKPETKEEPKQAETANQTNKVEEPKTSIEEPQEVTLNAIRPDKYFPTTVELLEINKSLRDQIQILREERDWLRERIEKLESRSEREQMLLLSESENLRSMINMNKKSFLQKTLPWLYKE